MSNTLLKLNPDYLRGKEDLLKYLIGVAQDTQGAEIWRAMFSEMLYSLGAMEDLEEAQYKLLDVTNGVDKCLT